MPRLGPFGLFICAVALMSVVGLGAAAMDYHDFQTTQETLEAKVLNKERLCKLVADYDTFTDREGYQHDIQNGSHQECKNYVHTDRETFTNDGVVWAGRTDGTALQGRLVLGETYTFRVYGPKDEKNGVFRKIVDVGPILPGGGRLGGGGASNW